jgi:nucleotide-binding universal stress UspA family protein
MIKFLVLVDGSAYSDRAVDYAIRRAAASRSEVHAHLLNVQAHVTGVNVKLFVSRESLDNFYRDEGMAVLAAPRRRLEEAGLAHEYHISVGDPGPVAVAFAQDIACDEIIMGTHGRGFLGGAVMGSVAQKVVQLSPVPVTLVK